jgi:hypothetical protein
VAFFGGGECHAESLSTTTPIETFFINTRFQPGGKRKAKITASAVFKFARTENR